MSPHRDDGDEFSDGMDSSIQPPSLSPLTGQDVMTDGLNHSHGASNGHRERNDRLCDNYDDDDVPGPLVNGRSNPNTDAQDHHVQRDRQSASSRQMSPYLRAAHPDSIYDLICVGFGPASLAVAVAIHDAVASGRQLCPEKRLPRILFLEKQPQFAWHAGMLLPGAKMQISFIKDLATLRDPKSDFTFLNYLHHAGRLVEFINLGTFLPARVEYEDYLRWSASFFDEVVRYGEEAVAVCPEKLPARTGPVGTFLVKSRNTRTGQVTSNRGRNVLLAVGGQPHIPKSLASGHPRIIHSSQYAHKVQEILNRREGAYHVAVVGAGQSAAEIFCNIQAMYPNSRTFLIMRSEFLKPSDDSPFVNSIFNPSFVDRLHHQPRSCRESILAEARSTNYGVVRLELLEQLYEMMYDQRREFGADERRWPHRVIGATSVDGVEASSPSDQLRLRLRSLAADTQGEDATRDTLDVDLVIAATGYRRSAHIDILHDMWDLLPEAGADVDEPAAMATDGWHVSTADGTERKLAVGRDYGVEFQQGLVEEGSGIWLQGCCEGTHGISDTLLSVLATRSGEIVNSIFGTAR